MRALLLLLLGLSMSAASTSSGRGGLEAVAASPDGKLIATGGQNRVVYLLDADSLEVKSRLWLGARVLDLAFSSDGKILAVMDDTRRVQLLDRTSGKPLAHRNHLAGFHARSSADLLVVRDVEDSLKHRLLILKLSTLEEIQFFELPDRPSAWYLDPDGKTLVVLSASKPGAEKAISVDELPRDLRGLERWIFRQKNDGLEATLYTYEIATGKLLGKITTWYTSDSDTTQLTRAGDTTFVFNRINHCARIGPRGETKMFATPEGTNNALACSPDGKLLLNGGMASGAFSTLEGDRRVLFRLEELPGQSEYVNRFAVASDGPIWAVTSAYRLIQLSRRGVVEKVVPVY